MFANMRMRKILQRGLFFNRQLLTMPSLEDSPRLMTGVPRAGADTIWNHQACSSVIGADGLEAVSFWKSSKGIRHFTSDFNDRCTAKEFSSKCIQWFSFIKVFQTM